MENKVAKDLEDTAKEMEKKKHKFGKLTIG